MSSNKSKRQETELDIQIKELVSSAETYFQGKDDIIQQVKAGKDQYIESVINEFNDVLIVKEGEPQKKFYILQLLKECMDTKQPKLINSVGNKSKTLNILEYYAKHEKGNPDEDRGRTIFDVMNKQTKTMQKQNAEIQQLGINFLQLVLECIFFWSIQYPMDSKKLPSRFKNSYDSLLKEKITFPTQFKFFEDQKPSSSSRQQMSKTAQPQKDNSNLQKQQHVAQSQIQSVSANQNKNVKFQSVYQGQLKDDQDKASEHPSKRDENNGNLAEELNSYLQKQVLESIQFIVQILQENKGYSDNDFLQECIPQQVSEMEKMSKQVQGYQLQLQSQTDLFNMYAGTLKQVNDFCLQYIDQVKVFELQGFQDGDYKQLQKSIIQSGTAIIKLLGQEITPGQFPESKPNVSKVQVSQEKQFQSTPLQSQQEAQQQQYQKLKKIDEDNKANNNNDNENNSNDNKFNDFNQMWGSKVPNGQKNTAKPTFQAAKSNKFDQFQDQSQISNPYQQTAEDNAKKNSQLNQSSQEETKQSQMQQKKQLDSSKQFSTYNFGQQPEKESSNQPKFQEQSSNQGSTFKSLFKDKVANQPQPLKQNDFQFQHDQNPKKSLQGNNYLKGSDLDEAPNFGPQKTAKTNQIANSKVNDFNTFSQAQNNNEFNNNNNNNFAFPTSSIQIKQSNNQTSSYFQQKSSKDQQGNNNGFEDNFDEKFSQMSVSTLSVHDFPLKNTDFQDNSRFKGQLICFDKSLFQDVLQSKLTLSHQRRYKISNLRSKCILLESVEIQIGLKTNLIFDYLSQRHHLKLSIYVGNKTHNPIQNLQLTYCGCDNCDVWTKPQMIDPFVEPKRQSKQELIIQYNAIPYSLISCELEALINNSKQVTTTVFLPNLLTKFMNFKKCNAISFKNQWKYKSENIIRTENFSINPKIIRNPKYFQRYFDKCVELNSLQDFLKQQVQMNQGQNQQPVKFKNYKLGGMFELSTLKIEFMIKFIICPNFTAVIQIIPFSSYITTAEMLLQHLQFILGS